MPQKSATDPSSTKSNGEAGPDQEEQLEEAQEDAAKKREQEGGYQ